MNPKTHSIIYRYVGMLVVAVSMLALPLHIDAQERKVQNRPYIDMRRWHYGFLFGIHVQDIEFVNNGFLYSTEEGTQESWFADVPTYTPGFTVGVLGEWRMTEHLALRLVPTMHFGDKMVVFREQQRGTLERQAIKSTYLTVPIEAKCTAQRFNNYRPYVMAGIAPSIDLTVKRQRALLVQRTDVALEVGMGCDFYLPFFKLIPELKFCFGLTDILVKKRNDLTEKDLLKYTHSLESATNRMMVLTFYFE